MDSGQTETFPEIDPGWAGTSFTVIARLCAAELPHPLSAVTEIAPELPAVTEMEFVVLVPLHPEGKLQV